MKARLRMPAWQRVLSCLAALMVVTAWLNVVSLAAGEKGSEKPDSQPQQPPPPLLPPGPGGQPPGSPQPPDIGPPPVILPPQSGEGSVFRVTSMRPSFRFTIDAKTPLKDLLPVPPKTKSCAGPFLGDDLRLVPEASFEEPLAKGLQVDKAREHVAHLLAKINHLNEKKVDGYMEALLKSRPDLSGLPMVLGEACRMKSDHGQEFNSALTMIRNALSQQLTIPISEAHRAPAHAAHVFWHRYHGGCFEEDQNNGIGDGRRKTIQKTRVAALMQVLGPDSSYMRQGLAKFLATISEVEATRALARLAIFAPEAEVRQAAIDGLKVRREKDYDEILLQGLRYPWPAVAARAVEVIVKLERKDLVPQLVAALDDPDPRAPALRKEGDKQIAVVREMVRINHHRNCLLCHAPQTHASGSQNTAPIPIPGEPLGTFVSGYQSQTPDILVRVDVTYLRQDFSVFMNVEAAHPWPAMQRFDFLVRTRTLSADEAKSFEVSLKKAAKGRLSPYQQTVLTALRELTGQDAEPTAQAWRARLKLPAPRLAPTRTNRDESFWLPSFPR